MINSVKNYSIVNSAFLIFQNQAKPLVPTPSLHTFQAPGSRRHRRGEPPRHRTHCTCEWRPVYYGRQRRSSRSEPDPRVHRTGPVSVGLQMRKQREVVSICP